MLQSSADIQRQTAKENGNIFQDTSKRLVGLKVRIELNFA